MKSQNSSSIAITTLIQLHKINVDNIIKMHCVYSNQCYSEIRIVLLVC